MYIYRKIAMENLQQSSQEESTENSIESIDQYVYYNSEFYSQSTIEDFKSENYSDNFDRLESLN